MVGQARAEVTRQRVIAAAVEIFEEFGYGDTSLSDDELKAALEYLVGKAK